MSFPRTTTAVLAFATLTVGAACSVTGAASPPEPQASTAPCPIGEFDVTSLHLPALSELGLDVAATGGSTRVRFDADGSWTLSDDGSRPMTIDVGPASARLRVDGVATGRYARRGAHWELWHTAADGSMALSGPFVSRTSVDLDDPDAFLMPDGQVRIACTPAGVTVAAEDGDIVMTLRAA